MDIGEISAFIYLFVQCIFMYVVSLEGDHGCNSNKHRHIIWIDYGICDFEISEFHYEKSEVVEYTVEMTGITGRYTGMEEIATLPSYEDACNLIDQIIEESSKEENRYRFFSCEDRRVYHSAKDALD